MVRAPSSLVVPYLTSSVVLLHSSTPATLYLYAGAYLYRRSSSYPSPLESRVRRLVVRLPYSLVALYLISTIPTSSGPHPPSDALRLSLSYPA